jgi:hypothetical protein
MKLKPIIIAATLVVLASPKAIDAIHSQTGCYKKLKTVFLKGSFQNMNLWIGKTHPKDKKVWGWITSKNNKECEAQCEMIHFEKDLMELQCEGVKIKSMRMPLHVHWVDSSSTFIRLGSSIYGTERVPLNVHSRR